MVRDLKHGLVENEINALQDFVSHFQPYDVAQKLVSELNNEEQVKLISILSVPLSTEILEYIEPEIQYNLLVQLDRNKTSQLLNEMSSDTVVDLLLAIHPHQAEKLLELLPSEYRKKISTLMNFPPDSAGSLATVEYIAARITWTADQTLQHVRKVGHDAEIVSYIYVLDPHGVLVGIVSLKDIILAHSDDQLEDIMRKDVISVPALMDQQKVASLLSNYDLVAIPVVHEGRMIGIITVDDLIDVIHEEVTEDFQKLGGSQPLDESYLKSSIWHMFRKRFGWLLILFAAEAYTGNVLRHYEDTLSEVIALTFFIPLLIGTGGNSGTQTVTTLVRALALDEVKFNDIFKVMRKEVTTGLFLGISMGIVAFIRAEILGVGFDIGTVVAVTAIFIVIWASFVAAILPLVLHKVKVDPAVVSGPLIATLVDGTGLMIYFTMARWLLHL